MFVEASEEQHAAFGDARSSTNAGRRGGGGGCKGHSKHSPTRRTRTRVALISERQASRMKRLTTNIKEERIRSFTRQHVRRSNVHQKRFFYPGRRVLFGVFAYGRKDVESTGTSGTDELKSFVRVSSNIDDIFKPQRSGECTNIYRYGYQRSTCFLANEDDIE